MAPFNRDTIDKRWVLEREDEMPIHPTQFQGFPKDTFSFLSDLSLNNQKAWFDANKDRFRRVVEQPVQEFVLAMCARLIHAFEEITHLEGKIFRIHRDIRFSKDKTPYKTHQGAFVRVGEATGCRIFSRDSASTRASSAETVLMMALDEASTLPARSLTASATTAKPRPASPARAASMVALSASRLVCSAMPWMVESMVLIS